MKFPALSLPKPAFIFLAGIAFAGAGARADREAGCAGLGNNGDYAGKLRERQGSGGLKTIGRSKINELLSQNEQIKKKLQACQQAVGNGLSTYNYGQIEDRLRRAAGAWKNYVDDQNEICRKYGQYADDVAKRANAVKNTAELSQKEYFTAAADMHRKNTGNYGALEKYAGESGEKLKDGLPGSGRDGDPRMESTLGQFRENLKGQVQSLETQAGRKLKDRAAQADGEVVVGKLRFRTQADVDRFYRGTGKCKEALKDLDRFGEKYKKLAQDLGEARQEAADAETAFRQKKDESWKQTNDLQAEANRLHESDKAPGAAATEAEAKTAVAPGTHAKTLDTPSTYSPAVQDELIAKGQDARRAKGGATVLGSFEKNGQWYTVYGAKSYDGDTPYYAKPGPAPRK